VPALGTINHALGRVKVVPRAVNRARPIWNTILAEHCHCGFGMVFVHGLADVCSDSSTAPLHQRAFDGIESVQHCI
jgi:hypothetical protein